MVEFTKMMNLGRRMCNEYVECMDCPMFRHIDERGEVCPFATDYDSDTIERIVMDWAAANPEPRYPTWREWQETIFPDSDELIEPCQYMSKEQAGCYGRYCSDCRDQPIPADVAEKLGIKPIGEL